MDYKITKARQIFEVNNDMTHNYYWLFNVRFEDDKHLRRLKFILWDDIFSVDEYFHEDEEKDYAHVTKKEIRDYMLDIAYATLSTYFGWGKYDNTPLAEVDFSEFIEYCNKTIEDYNR